MVVIGFNFTKLLGEKTAPTKGKINIRNNVVVTDVEESSLALEKNKKALNVLFRFNSTYDPEIAQIIIEGNVLFMEDDKKTDALFAEWKKDRRMSRDVMTEIINTILARCNIQALIMSRDLNLPTPIPLPKITSGQQTTASKPAVKKTTKKKAKKK